MPITVKDLRIVCSKCQDPARDRIFPNTDIASFTGGEVWDAVQGKLIAEGWAVRVNPDPRVKRVAICPTCVAAEIAAIGALENFNKESQCPKCGERNLSVKYMTGREPTSLVLKEHLERTCTCCGFKFAQNALTSAQ